MDNHIKAVVSRERDHNMFAELSAAHHVLLENAKQQRDGYFYESLSCLIFAAFKFEAFLNHIGYRLLPSWAQMERLPNENKLAIITTHLDVTPDFSRRPYQTLSDLFKARDAVAHGKPALLKHDRVIETGEIETLRRKKPLTHWEKLCTIDFAQRAYADTEEIAASLWQAGGLCLIELRERGHSYSIEPIPPKNKSRTKSAS